jgi:hypothetical protein
MENTELKKIPNKKNSTGQTNIRKPKFNHLINVFIYKNIALFKGDTFPYRGTFNRFGGEFNKKFYGYLIPLDRMVECKMEISKFVESLLVYKKDENLDIGNIKNSMIDNKLDDYDNNETNVNNNLVMDI